MYQPKHKDFEKHYTASALIFHEGKVLLAHHKKLGVWLYPGGHIESHETPDQAVLREVKEETNLEVRILEEQDESLASEAEDLSALHRPYAILCENLKDHYHIDLIYRCEIIGNPTDVNHNVEESHDIRFFSEDELVGVDLFDSFRVLLKKAFLELK